MPWTDSLGSFQPTVEESGTFPGGSRAVLGPGGWDGILHVKKEVVGRAFPGGEEQLFQRPGKTEIGSSLVARN